MIFIFGHKNPDTDAVVSAIALSRLKNRLGFDTIPGILNEINKETAYILDYLDVPVPRRIENVKIQVRDLSIDHVEGISPRYSILHAYRTMEKNKQKTLAVTDNIGKLTGLVSVKDIAMELIQGDFYTLDTSVENILQDLNGTLLCGESIPISGTIRIMAFDYKSIKGYLDENTIMIVGDRYDIIEHAINSGVKLIIITGGKPVPEQYIAAARSKGIPVVSIPADTYTAAKLINQCNYISTIMVKEDIVKFTEDSYLDDIRETLIETNFRNYPVVDGNNHFLGFIGRRHIINPGRKKVILVDHNEYSQSAEGLDEADILEIVDHHKIGDISTSLPIRFSNLPVGSTCTILYGMFREHKQPIDRQTAGLMLSGIISDTLLFRSPTTTSLDREAAEELNKIAGLDLQTYSSDMFKAGTSLEGFTVSQIVFRDFKEFTVDNHKIGIGQILTLDIDSITHHKEEIYRFISEIQETRGYYLVLLLITDIIREGSYLLYHSSNRSLIPAAFNVEDRQGVYVHGLISRKKQVVPMLMQAVRSMK